MKKKLITIAVLLVSVTLFACNQDTTASDTYSKVEMVKTAIKLTHNVGEHTYTTNVYINPKTECMYTGGKTLTPIVEQVYVYDITGGKCEGPYQREYNSK